MAASDVVRGVDNQTSGTSAATGIFITLSAPAGIVSGDKLVVGIQLREPPSSLTNWTPPAGWTLVPSPALASGSAYVYTATYGTDVSGSSWTWSNGTGNTTTTRWAASLVCLIGSSVGAYQTGAVAAVSGSPVVTPSITTTGSTYLVGLVGSRTTGGPSFTWPATWVEEGDVNTGTATNSASSASAVYDTTPATAGTYSASITPSLAVSAGYAATLAFAASTSTGSATATFSATGTLSATGAPVLKGTATLGATGTLTTGTQPQSGSGSVALSATGTLTATGVASFAHFDFTVTADPTNRPPRVRIDINDTRTTKATSVTITRTDGSGHSAPVRTADGNPLVLSNGVATIWDYEAPYQQILTYTTNVAGSPTVTTSLSISDTWLIHPGQPSKSVTVDMLAGAGGDETWSIPQGVFNVLGRSNPIVVTAGARTSASSTLQVFVQNATDLGLLQSLLSDGSPLLLNGSGSNLGLPTAYIAVGDVRVARPVTLGTDPTRTITLAYQIVDRPSGGTQAAITWADIAAKYATWDAIKAAGITSWSQLAAPTT